MNKTAMSIALMLATYNFCDGSQPSYLRRDDTLNDDDALAALVNKNFSTLSDSESWLRKLHPKIQARYQESFKSVVDEFFQAEAVIPESEIIIYQRAVAQCIQGIAGLYTKKNPAFARQCKTDKLTETALKKHYYALAQVFICLNPRTIDYRCLLSLMDQMHSDIQRITQDNIEPKPQLSYPYSAMETGRTLISYLFWADEPKHHHSADELNLIIHDSFVKAVNYSMPELVDAFLAHQIDPQIIVPKTSTANYYEHAAKFYAAIKPEHPLYSETTRCLLLLEAKRKGTYRSHLDELYDGNAYDGHADPNFDGSCTIL